MRKSHVCFGLLLPFGLAVSPLLAQSNAPAILPTPRPHATGHAAHTVVTAGSIAWQDAPPNLPPGARVAVIQGDPTRVEPFVIRLKVPDGYKIPAHWHPKAENLTVLQGTFYLGTGDKLDESKGSPLEAGDFSMMPARMHHFAWCKGETIVQAHGMGPFQLIYVEPKDDPSKTAKK
jgi:anti-sigma factor ChrR (cupin superfamily)